MGDGLLQLFDTGDTQKLSKKPLTVVWFVSDIDGRGWGYLTHTRVPCSRGTCGEKGATIAAGIGIKVLVALHSMERGWFIMNHVF